MATLKTEITEIVTGLAMLGYNSLERALSVRPRAMSHVSNDHFDRLDAAYADGKHRAEFLTAWDNGWAFARSQEGLRGRPPWSLEWKGPHKPPGYEQIPADLRIDHVFLVSCKYGSSILHNASPSHLFDRGLAEKKVERGTDWFAATAPEAFQEFYEACVELTGLRSMPGDVTSLTPAQRKAIKQALPPGRRLPDSLQQVYESFCLVVGQQSAIRWLDQLRTKKQKEEMFWRLLRLQAAPYFVLGATHKGEPLRYRVGTPWDFRDRFDARRFDVWADPAGQPLVRWRADTIDRLTSEERAVEGHVEIRWSHGKFSGAPEAKVHLDTHPHHVAGYFPIEVAESGQSIEQGNPPPSSALELGLDLGQGRLLP